MNKQIEEIANIIHDADMKIILDMVKATPDDFVGRALPRQVYIAKALHKEGYRKASDVAMEIFEEIELLLDTYSASHHSIGEVCGESYFERGLEDAIAELKKKYESEVEE